MTRYPNLQPLGKLTVTTPGTTVALSTNSGSMGGGSGSYSTPALAGNAFRQFQLQCDNANTGSLYLLPRGKTAAGNPEAILMRMVPGQTYPFPNGVSDSAGYLPENFVLDTDTAGTQVCYGCGFFG